MLALYLWIYTLILALLWGFFIVAKIHAYKFKNFSHSIPKVTNVLLTFLIVFSILGYVLIIASVSNTSVKVDNYSSFDTKNVNY